MIPLIFIINLVIWVCSISFFSVLGTWRYLEALVGGNTKLFFLMCGYRAVFLFPPGVMLGLIFVFFFLMRHRSVVFISVPLALVMGAALVVFAIPYSFSVLSGLETRFPDAMRTLTAVSSSRFEAGAIRSGADGSRWIDISGDTGAKRQIAVVRGGSESGSLSLYSGAVYDSGAKTLVAAGSAVVPAAGGIDPLYAGYVELPYFIRSVIADCTRVFDAFRLSSSQGLIPYLWIAGSFFAAVMSLWLLCYSTRWRMINVLLVAAALRGLFYVYRYTIGGMAYEFALKFRPPFVPAEIISPCFYLAFTCLFVLAGGLVFLVRKIRHAGSEASYG